MEATSGILLMLMAAIALVWANSPWSSSYEHLLHTPLSVRFGEYSLTQTLHFWINEILMVLFFFVVGLEIRRELHAGVLSDARRAALPLAAALGGTLLPALIYLSFNAGSSARGGWGVPMATDIAFAVGVLALLGKRVPSALRVLLLAVAIIDDVAAVLVIALFYSSGIALSGLAVAATGVAAVLSMQRLGVRNPLLYVVPGAVVWGGLLHAGIHPTLAGVILGLLTPARAWIGREGFLEESKRTLESFERNAAAGAPTLALLPQLDLMNQARREAIPPVTRIEAALHPWVAFGIMPLFALANAGVALGGIRWNADTASGIVFGISLGLIFGKPLGIVLISWLAVRFGLASLPHGVSWPGLLVVGCVAGIGFTMALFISALAFPNPLTLPVAKFAVLIGSAVAAAAGLLVGHWALARHTQASPQPTEGVAD